MQKKVKLQKTNAITVFGAGHQALAEIEGLRGMAVRGMFFNYLIFFDSFTGVERFVLFSTSRSVYQLAFWWRSGFWAAVGTIVLWSIQLTVAAVIAMVSLRFSVELLSLWHQSLVQRIITHFRQIEEPVFSFKAWLAEINHILKEALKACLFPVLLIFVGLIPVIGLPIVFMLESHLMGREGVIVYLDSLTNQEEAVELRKMWRWMPIRIGWLTGVSCFYSVCWLVVFAAVIDL